MRPACDHVSGSSRVGAVACYDHQEALAIWRRSYAHTRLWTFVDSLSPVWHSIHMKRTNLVLHEDLLEEALRLSGERTYSRAVERALEEFVKRRQARKILQLAGSGLWEGDLAMMRDDRPTYRKRRRGSR